MTIKNKKIFFVIIWTCGEKLIRTIRKFGGEIIKCNYGEMVTIEFDIDDFDEITSQFDIINIEKVEWKYGNYYKNWSAKK